MVEYVGLDVSKEETSFSIRDDAGEVVARGKAASDPESIFEHLREHCLCPERIVLETGSQSHWLARGLLGFSLPVEVIDARQAHAVMKLQRNKTDKNDADLLSKLAYCGFTKRVEVSQESNQTKQALLRARQHLVHSRRQTQNTIRGLMMSFGLKFPKGVGKLKARVALALSERPDLGVFIKPLMEMAETLAAQILRLDREVKAQAHQDDDVKRLMTIPGVGPNTALAFKAIIADPTRFKNARTVGAYVGLTSRRFQSGEKDYTGRISRQGNTLLRWLLYEAANAFLCLVRRKHALKDWANRLRKRSSYKKACVALARKLAIIMHRMLTTGESFRWV